MRFTRFKDMISYYADNTPDAPALRYEEDGAICTLTCAELAAAVDLRRAELERIGGTCLGVIADGSVECAITLLAAPASGMRTVLFDAAMQEETLKALTERLEVDRMFAEGKAGDMDMFFAPISEKAQALKNHDIEDALRDGKDERSEDPAEKVVCREGQRKEQSCRGSEEGEILFFTSGTTGGSRAVILTEQTLCASAYNGSAMLPLTSEDVLLCILPLNHVFGFVCGFLWGLSCGACVALGRGARHYIDDCAFFKPTTISAVPMLFGFLLKHSLLNPECKLVLVGAGDCPASLPRTAKAQGIRVSFGYGLTETSSGVAISVEGDPYAMAVCPDNEITIAEDGEILVKAPTCVMKGYAGEPEATAEVLRDEVLATGDLGYLDQDGKLHVTGRKKEMLVLADGTKLFLPEAEAELAALLGTSDLAIVSAGEQPVLILGGNLEDRKTAAEITATSEKPIEKQMADRKPENSETICEKETGEKTSDRIREEAIIWEKIRTFQDARPRGQQISAIRWYGKPLPRTATGKLKRWMLGRLSENSKQSL